MLRRIAVLGLALAACKGQGSGPVLAKGEGVEITESEYRAEIADMPAVYRAQLAAPGKKKQLLEAMVREEVLLRKAEEEGLADDPQVKRLVRRFMVSRLQQKNAQQTDPATIPEAEVEAYFQEHAGEYEKRVAGSVIAFLAPAGSPERAKKRAAAQKALATLRDAERKTAAAPSSVVKPAAASPAKPAPAAAAPSVASVFTKLVNELSEDPASKRFSGSLGSKTRAELEKVHPEIAAVLFSLPQNAVSDVIETPQGFYVARVNVVREALTLDQVRPQIQMRLARKQDEKAKTEFVEKLQAEAKVVIDEKALEAVDLSEQQPPGPGSATPASGQPAEKK